MKTCLEIELFGRLQLLNKGPENQTQHAKVTGPSIIGLTDLNDEETPNEGMSRTRSSRKALKNTSAHIGLTQGVFTI